MAIPKANANFQSSLAVKMSSTASSFTLNDSTDDDGSSLSGTYQFVFDEGTSKEEHVIASMSGAAGTVTTRGCSRVDGKTLVAGNRFEHDRGATVKMSNVQLIRVINRLNGDEAFDSPDWTGVQSIDGLATPTSGETTKAANVDYVNSIAISGSPDATESIKGIVELATQAEIDAGTETGGVGPLTVNPKNLATSIYKSQLPSADEKAALAGTSGTPASGNKYVTNDDTSATAAASKVVRSGAGSKIAEGYLQMTDAQATTLTDGSNADELHVHFPSITDYANFKLGWEMTVDAVGGSTGSHTRAALSSRIATGASANNYNAFDLDISNVSANDEFDWDNDYVWVGSFRLEQVDACRAFFGLGYEANIDPTTTGGRNESAAFFYDEAQELRAYLDNGTNYEESAPITGYTLTDYNDFKIVYTGGTDAKFYINGTLVATLNTYMPSGSTDFNPIHVSLATTENAAKYMNYKTPIDVYIKA